MKEPKRIELPREVWMGPKVLKEITDICIRLQLGKHALVVADQKTFELAGKKIEHDIKKRFDAKHVLIKRADIPTVERIRKLAKEIDFLIGVGGGSCIDAAKLASFQERKPFISVPTAASHDGISSSRASIKGGKEPTSIQTHAPVAIIADTAIIRKAPYRLLATGCGDLVANFTAVRDWELAHRLKGEPYSEYAAALAAMSAQIVMEAPELIRKYNEESVRRVVKALISSGVAMAIAGSSRPASGAEHLFSHALDMLAPHPALHGEQCGVGAIMMAYLHGEDWRAIRDALHVIGAPTNAKELHVPPNCVIKALTIAHKIRKDRYTILGKGLSEKAARRLAKETGVIER